MADLITPRVLPAFKGRYSFNELSAEKAHEDALAGPYAKTAKAQGASKPYANILVTETQWDLIVQFLEESFFPFSVAQKAGEKHHIDKDDADAMLAQIKAGKQKPYQIPVKMPSDATLELWPEAHRMIKTVGRLGVDIIEQAIVNGPDELKIPDPDRTKFPDRLAIHETTHSLYRGCWVVGAIEVYCYQSGGSPGLNFNLVDHTIVFARDDEPFGGGARLSEGEDDLFAAASSI